MIHSSINDTQAPTLYEKLVETGNFEKLDQRFNHSKKTFSQSWRWLKILTYWGSFFLNVLSVCLGWAGLYFLFSFVLPDTAAGILSAVLLSFVEIAKRLSSDGLWDYYFPNKKTIHLGYLSLSFFLFLCSSASSGYGTHQSVFAFAAKPPTLSAIEAKDSTLIALNAQLDTIQLNIHASKKTTWRGVITTRSQDAIKEYSKQKTPITNLIVARKKQLQKEQLASVSSTETTTDNMALTTLLLCILFEIIFECCMCFCSYYDFRLYLETIERGQHGTSSGGAPTPPSNTGGTGTNNGGINQGANDHHWNNNAAVLNRSNMRVLRDNETMQQRDNEIALNELSSNTTDKTTSNTIGEMLSETASKTPETHRTIYVPTDLTIEHKDRQTGKIKRMNITDVRRNISANKSRFRKAKRAGKATAKIDFLISYWLEKERELVEKAEQLVCA